jgi:hypothetical protein
MLHTSDIYADKAGGYGCQPCFSDPCCCARTPTCPSPPHPPPPHTHTQIKHPVTGGDGYEPCAPMAAGAQECTLQYFADKGIADQVVPPVITMKDFEKVLERARPTVSTKDLEVGGGGGRGCVGRGGGGGGWRGGRGGGLVVNPAVWLKVQRNARPTVSTKDLEVGGGGRKVWGLEGGAGGGGACGRCSMMVQHESARTTCRWGNAIHSSCVRVWL